METPNRLLGRKEAREGGSAKAMIFNPFTCPFLRTMKVTYLCAFDVQGMQSSNSEKLILPLGVSTQPRDPEADSDLHFYHSDVHSPSKPDQSNLCFPIAPLFFTASHIANQTPFWKYQSFLRNLGNLAFSMCEFLEKKKFIFPSRFIFTQLK